MFWPTKLHLVGVPHSDSLPRRNKDNFESRAWFALSELGEAFL